MPWVLEGLTCNKRESKGLGSCHFVLMHKRAQDLAQALSLLVLFTDLQFLKCGLFVVDFGMISWDLFWRKLTLPSVISLTYEHAISLRRLVQMQTIFLVVSEEIYCVVILFFSSLSLKNAQKLLLVSVVLWMVICAHCYRTLECICLFSHMKQSIFFHKRKISFWWTSYISNVICDIFRAQRRKPNATFNSFSHDLSIQ